MTSAGYRCPRYGGDALPTVEWTTLRFLRQRTATHLEDLRSALAALPARLAASVGDR
ncbi:hypothetical protein PYS65_01980 [Streptomyces cathayae]|uniref:Uncharacterized protein n=1 Tax=Streptomyces cathayae TaxID=3031124 RepID=A0ABY8JYC8_9ACTN|nr:hypothetical protein [Streptomyces sp. HUAS 5]WGD39037.1 hypothetical protein PYS65_01980 [Streptomyces sp. HUAS 5]